MQQDKVKNVLPEYYRKDGRCWPPHVALPLTNNMKTCLKELSAEKISGENTNKHHDTTCEKPDKSPWINAISLHDDYQSDF
ncbi:hypothetical protein [Edwardsiella tarda]|uniref:hypothetical protein n=1 Tax=Edwardsiella tarda TaxID=636 RepID=UPI0015628473|nr:hypothetical protein [Edwardsiella tarda]